MVGAFADSTSVKIGSLVLSFFRGSVTLNMTSDDDQLSALGTFEHFAPFENAISSLCRYHSHSFVFCAYHSLDGISCSCGMTISPVYPARDEKEKESGVVASVLALTFRLAFGLMY